MDFFDPKEDVLEVKLTPWGRYKLSKGGFRPVWYAFFDEGILYNSEWAGFEEPQNNIHDRIMDDTPRLKPLNVTDGIQTAITRRNEAIQKIFGTQIALAAGAPAPHPDAEHMTQEELQAREADVEENLSEVTIAGAEMFELSSDPLFMEPGDVYNREELQYTTNKMKALENPLGTSKLSSDKNPAWAVKTYLGEISSSLSYFSGSTDVVGDVQLIPQINIVARYNTYAAKIPEYSADMGTDADFFQTEATNTHNLEAVTTDILPDGTYLVIEKGELVLGIEEKNADFYKENFDIEVMLSSSAHTIDTKHLKFNNSTNPVYSQDDVQYYLTLNADNEIGSDILQKANIQDFTALGSSEGAGTISTRQYFVKDLYSPEEDLCEE